MDITPVPAVRVSRAVAVGFEPTVVLPTHAFEACSFGRSDTPPRQRLQDSATALRREELPHQRRPPLGPPPAHDPGPVIEPPVTHHIPQRPDRAGLGIPGTEDDTVDPGQHE